MFTKEPNALVALHCTTVKWWKDCSAALFQYASHDFLNVCEAPLLSCFFCRLFHPLSCSSCRSSFMLLIIFVALFWCFFSLSAAHLLYMKLELFFSNLHICLHQISSVVLLLTQACSAALHHYLYYPKWMTKFISSASLTPHPSFCHIWLCWIARVLGQIFLQNSSYNLSSPWRPLTHGLSFLSFHKLLPMQEPSLLPHGHFASLKALVKDLAESLLEIWVGSIGVLSYSIAVGIFKDLNDWEGDMHL